MIRPRTRLTVFNEHLPDEQSCTPLPIIDSTCTSTFTHRGAHLRRHCSQRNKQKSSNHTSLTKTADTRCFQNGYRPNMNISFLRMIRGFIPSMRRYGSRKDLSETVYHVDTNSAAVSSGFSHVPSYFSGERDGRIVNLVTHLIAMLILRI
jgi:hypothetical protein